MYLRFVRTTKSLFGHPPKITYTYTHMAQITRMEVDNKSLMIMESNGSCMTYNFMNVKNAQKMAERIIAFKANPKGLYLDITDEVHQESMNNKKTYQQRMDQPGPDVDALMILQEYDKSLMVIKDQNKNIQLK